MDGGLPDCHLKDLIEGEELDWGRGYELHVEGIVLLNEDHTFNLYSLEGRT